MARWYEGSFGQYRQSSQSIHCSLELRWVLLLPKKSTDEFLHKVELRHCCVPKLCRPSKSQTLVDHLDHQESLLKGNNAKVLVPLSTDETGVIFKKNLLQHCEETKLIILILIMAIVKITTFESSEKQNFLAQWLQLILLYNPLKCCQERIFIFYFLVIGEHSGKLLPKSVKVLCIIEVPFFQISSHSG